MDAEDEENVGQWSPKPINIIHVGVSDDVVFEDVALTGYQHHPFIKFEVAV